MVRFQGHQILIPKELDQSLDEIVRADICFEKIKKVGSEGREIVARRIISMLDIKFEFGNVFDENGEIVTKEDLAISEFKTFIRDYDLTTEEIIFAYKLALRKELLNTKEEVIDVYPNLKLNQCGEILSSYLRYKAENQKHSIGISKIKKFIEEKTEKTKEVLQKERQERFNNLVKMVLENEGDFSDIKFSIASFFYDDFKDEFPELSKEEKERILISKQKAEILKERKREKKLHLTPIELKKADEILSSGKYLPKDHIIYNLALMEIKKELVIDFILSKFKTKN